MHECIPQILKFLSRASNYDFITFFILFLFCIVGNWASLSVVQVEADVFPSSFSPKKALTAESHMTELRGRAQEGERGVQIDDFVKHSLLLVGDRADWH